MRAASEPSNSRSWEACEAQAGKNTHRPRQTTVDGSGGSPGEEGSYRDSPGLLGECLSLPEQDLGGGLDSKGHCDETTDGQWSEGSLLQRGRNLAAPRSCHGVLWETEPGSNKTGRSDEEVSKRSTAGTNSLLPLGFYRKLRQERDGSKGQSLIQREAEPKENAGKFSAYPYRKK